MSQIKVPVDVERFSASEDRTGEESLESVDKAEKQQTPSQEQAIEVTIKTTDKKEEHKTKTAGKGEL